MPLSSVLGAQSLVKPGVCTSSTRPASPFEGQTIYETDTDRLATWDGSAWIAYVRQTAGKVLQVVSTAKTDAFSTTSTSYTDITGLTASITPSSSSSKILVMFDLTGSQDVSVNDCFISLVRDSTEIFRGDAAGSRTRATISLQSQNADHSVNGSMTYLDSPATTSSVTYKPQIRTGGSTVFINRSDNDNDSAGRTRSVSSITLMEISG